MQIVFYETLMNFDYSFLKLCMCVLAALAKFYERTETGGRRLLKIMHFRNKQSTAKGHFSSSAWTSWKEWWNFYEMTYKEREAGAEERRFC